MTRTNTKRKTAAVIETTANDDMANVETLAQFVTPIYDDSAVTLGLQTIAAIVADKKAATALAKNKLGEAWHNLILLPLEYASVTNDFTKVASLIVQSKKLMDGTTRRILVACMLNAHFDATRGKIVRLDEDGDKPSINAANLALLQAHTTLNSDAMKTLGKAPEKTASERLMKAQDAVEKLQKAGISKDQLAELVRNLPAVAA